MFSQEAAAIDFGHTPVSFRGGIATEIREYRFSPFAK